MALLASTALPLSATSTSRRLATASSPLSGARERSRRFTAIENVRRLALRSKRSACSCSIRPRSFGLLAASRDAPSASAPCDELLRSSSEMRKASATAESDARPPAGISLPSDAESAPSSTYEPR